MKKISFTFLLIIMFSMGHPFYLSVCDLKYNTSTRKLEGTVKIFISDLEDALKRLENKKVDLIHPNNKNENLALFNKYLKNRLKLKTDNKNLTYELLGYEIEEESIWIYLESETCQSPKSLGLENGILCDFLKEQMNIMNIEIGALKKSYKLNCPENQVLFEF